MDDDTFYGDLPIEGPGVSLIDANPVMRVDDPGRMLDDIATEGTGNLSEDDPGRMLDDTATEGTGNLSEDDPGRMLDDIVKEGEEGPDWLKNIPDALKGFLKGVLVDDKGKPNLMGIMALSGLLSQLGKGSAAPPVGYQGGIPSYTAVRQQVPYAADPNRRPGAGGRQYFTPMENVAAGKTAADTTAAVDAARARATTKAQGIASAYPKAAAAQSDASAPMTKMRTGLGGGAAPSGYYYGPADELVPDNINTMNQYQSWRASQDRSSAAPNAFRSALTAEEQRDPATVFAERIAAAKLAGGGLLNLAKGRYLNGSSDGMADKIPANIEGKQPARLSHGEFVIPADVVSHLGNGNSEAGAERLYSMMDRIRKARTGTPKQGKQINPDKYTPA